MKHLKNLKNNINKKVIVATSYNTQEVIREVSDYGVNYYILKPFDLTELENRILDIFNSLDGMITEIDNKNRTYYPGSTISLGFDELGSHGMIAGEITKDRFSMEFVELDDRRFEEIEIKVDDIYSKEELAEKILDRYFNDMTMYKVVLVGKRNFEIDTRILLQMVSHDNILKIKDCTKIAYDLESIAMQDTLKGMFVREVCKMYEQGLCSEEEYQKAIEIGLEAM